MFNATYFTYDGQWSGTYGLQIVDFDTNPVKETDVTNAKLTLQKVPGSLRFFHGGVEYDSAPACEFSVLSQDELTSDMRSAVLTWLIGKKQFKALRFDSADHNGFTYYCVFTSAKTIWINGHCHGFRLTAQFDSQYARGSATSVTVEAGTHTVAIHNQSDITDEYTYPIVVFTGGSIDIVNVTDDDQRHFTFSDLSVSEVITVDNEVKYISSSEGGEKLSNFTSKKWLRLRPGINILTIATNGSATITCPHYAMIGY